jgi:RecQ-mediated genome instability protein 1
MWQCVLTGVKDFQFKAGDEFRLIVYVDDGSLTSEVLIHNQVVQSMVGFSAKEVSNALASSNQQELQDMKNVMMEFQTFLKKFEGLMDVELRDTLTIPVVLKMTESANAIDANILLQRVSNSWSMQP